MCIWRAGLSRGTFGVTLHPGIGLGGRRGNGGRAEPDVKNPFLRMTKLMTCFRVTSRVLRVGSDEGKELPLSKRRERLACVCRFDGYKALGMRFEPTLSLGVVTEGAPISSRFTVAQVDDDDGDKAETERAPEKRDGESNPCWPHARVRVAGETHHFHSRRLEKRGDAAVDESDGPKSKQSGKREMRMKRRILVCLGLIGMLIVQIPLSGFTQGLIDLGSILPVGHEWITRQAAIEVLGVKPDVVPYDPNDPRLNWPQHERASHLSLAGAEKEVARIKSVKVDDPRAAATFKLIADAIIGERWGDIGGVNVAKAKLDSIDCFDNVAQEPSDIQYDHFMRRPDDKDACGGVTAAQESGRFGHA